MSVKSLKGCRVTSDAKSAESAIQRINHSTISICNRQRSRKINSRRLREIAVALLAGLPVAEVELGVNLVGAREMALVNETFLQHAGPTDVITFDHLSSEFGIRNSEFKLHGELFICVDVALAQAREFKSTWQSEVVRYLVHGVLHLLGHDDLSPGPRRRMKRVENRLVRQLARKFTLAQIGARSKISA